MLNPCKKIIKSCLLASIGLLVSFQENSFKLQQLKNKRVKAAYEHKWAGLQSLLAKKGVNEGHFELYVRVFKEEGLLEAWVKSGNAEHSILLKTFAICAKSGVLGPKRKQGDGQVPEGFYEISSFQPQSSYHLALKVGYPNKSDRLKATSKDPGGDIMIHGNCVTIGCIPLLDDPIEELYVLSVEAKNHGSVIFTDIYPFKFNEKNLEKYDLNADSDLSRFWKSLKPAYDYFEKNKRRAKISTNTKGNYQVTY